MAGSLDGRARRVRRLEERAPGGLKTSAMEREARALLAEIRALDEQIEATEREERGCAGQSDG